MTRAMKEKKRIKLFRGPARGLLDEDDPLDAPARGPLFSRRIFVGLLTVFGVSLMLTADWFGLLLLNSDGVSGRIGPLNVVRVMAVLMAGIAIPSGLLMLHYKRIYSYDSEENVFFAITFAISFMLGFPCALVGLFG